jgi:16S rRNA (guanine(1405)-N(7))-methyltransferase
MGLRLPEELLEQEITAICQRYKIAPQDARTVAERSIQRRPDLLNTILAKYPHEDVTRLRAYKTLIKEVRKQVYYSLRQYQPEKETIPALRERLSRLVQSEAPAEALDEVIQQLLCMHISTKERMESYDVTGHTPPFSKGGAGGIVCESPGEIPPLEKGGTGRLAYDAFYQTLFDIMEPPRTILDLGCGLHPLSYPFNHPTRRPDVYVALDTQIEVIDTLTVFAPYVSPTQLLPLQRDIAEVDWNTIVDEGHVRTFDVVFMLKLISVVARQQRHLLPKLAAVPARCILITAATESMTRKENIKRREERVLRDFISRTRREVTATFNVGQEFGYLLGEFS